MYDGERLLPEAQRRDFLSGVTWPQVFCVLRIRAKRVGDGKFLALCPFHSERTPSCRFWPKSQRFFCFGCHSTGDMIQFVCRHYDVTEDHFLVAEFFASLPILPLPEQLPLIPLPGRQLALIPEKR